MGHGERRGRRRTRFGRKRNRVGVRRYGRRRGGGQAGALGALIGKLCVFCISTAVDLIREYQKKLDSMKAEQDEILQEKAKREEQKKMAAEKAEAEASETQKPEAAQSEADEEESERIKELQEDQMELLNEIMEKISNEKDPGRLQTLINQQNVLIGQMTQLQGVGYEYDKEIPKPEVAE